MAKIQFKHDMGDLRERTQALPDEIDRFIKAVMARQAPIATADMKENAPWTDRTGAARTGLFVTPPQTTKISDLEAIYRLVFGYSVYYGIWLELANSGRYQILIPSIIKHGKEIMANLEDLFGELERMRRR